MSHRALVVPAAGLLLLAGMALFTARNLQLSTGLASLLSESSDLELAHISARLVDSPLTRTMVLSVTAPDLRTALKTARRWQAVLQGHPEVESVRAGPDPEFARAVFELYFPRRLLLLSSQPEVELAQRLSPAELRNAARRLREQLALPQAQLVKEIAGQDPLLAFPALLREFEGAQQGPLELVSGQFASPAERAAILFLTTRHSAFDVAHQAPLEAFLERSFAELATGQPGAVRLERSGVHRFAVASEQRARADMQGISAVSLVGIVLLFLVVFGSLRLLVISLLPIAGGVLTATSVGILIFGELGLMTLVFGSTLIGVCIDYPIHYVSHHTLVPAPDGPRASLAQIWGALVMGALTTVAGFVGLAWSDFPGIREIGIFAGTGVIGALVTTRVLLPPLLPRAPVATPLQAGVSQLLARLLAGMRERRLALVLLLLGAVAVTAVGLPHVSMQDDVFALGLSPPEGWLAEDAGVRGRVAQMDPGRFVVSIAESEQDALRLNDAAYERLVSAREAGEITGFRSLHVFLPSVSLQERNRGVLADMPELPRQMLSALSAEGFRPDAFEGFTRALADHSTPPLRFADLVASSLASSVAAFRVDLGERVALLTFLQGVSDPAALGARLADLDGVHYFDQRRFLAQIYGRYRERTSVLIAVGLAAVVALLFARYRSIGIAVATALPAVLAAALTLALLGIAGIPISLLHLLGLLLVLSIGVDYAIFLVASDASGPGRAAALLSLCAACLSTCLAFGLLAASSFPALRALGLSTAIGVPLSLVLAPAVLLLTGPNERAP
ncbi:MAG: MMPL family transporter [bacterium]|nr:MMPL family transporter [bacterium]